MSKIEKLLSRVEELDGNLTFSELAKIMKYLGYTASYPRGGSSHCTFRKPGCMPVTIPKKVNRAYIRLVRDVLSERSDRYEGS